MVDFETYFPMNHHFVANFRDVGGEDRDKRPNVMFAISVFYMFSEIMAL